MYGGLMPYFVSKLLRVQIVFVLIYYSCHINIKLTRILFRVTDVELFIGF